MDRFSNILFVAESDVPRLASELTAELVVMGTVGRTGIPGYIIGNTAESVLGELDCLILAVKPAEFVSPITVA